MRGISKKYLIFGALLIVIISVGCTGEKDNNGSTTTTLPSTKAPIANAGGDVSLEAGTVMTYDAGGSSDADGGSIVSYEWKIIGTPEGKEDAIGNVIYTGTEPKWTTANPMKPAAIGEWTVELKVTDDEGETAVDIMVVTVIESYLPLPPQPIDNEEC